MQRKNFHFSRVYICILKHCQFIRYIQSFASLFLIEKIKVYTLEIYVYLHSPRGITGEYLECNLGNQIFMCFELSMTRTAELLLILTDSIVKLLVKTETRCEVYFNTQLVKYQHFVLLNAVFVGVSVTSPLALPTGHISCA